MVVDEVGLHASEAVGVVELHADVVINGQDDGVGADEQLLGLGEQGVAAGGIGLGAGGLQMGVVGGAFPAGAVVAAGADKHFQEGVGIVVIAHPTGAAHLVVEAFHGGEIDFPLLFDELDVDAEVLFPHALQLDRDVGLDGFWEVKVLDAWQAFAVGETGFGKQGAGAGGIETEPGRRLVVGGAGAGWGEAPSGDLAELGDFVGDALAVDSQGEGLADFGVIEWGFGDVETGEVGAEEGSGVEPGFGFKGGGEGGGHHAFVHDQIGLAGEEVVDGGVGLGDGEDLDGFHCDVGGVPVVRVFSQPHVVVQLPGFEQVGAVADEVLRFDPGTAMFFQGGQVDGGEGGEGAEVDEVGGGIFQADGEGVVVEGGDADLGEVGEGAVVESAGVGDEVELAGVVGSGGGIEHAPPGADEVVRGDGIAIAPGGGGAEVKRVVFAVSGDVPPFGHAGLGFASLVDAAEAFEQGGRDAHADLVGDDGRVKRLRFSTVDEDKISAVLDRAAAGESKAEEREDSKAGHAARVAEDQGS